MNNSASISTDKKRYDIAKLEKQWLWYICAVLLLVLLFVASFVCFYQAFALAALSHTNK